MGGTWRLSIPGRDAHGAAPMKTFHSPALPEDFGGYPRVPQELSERFVEKGLRKQLFFYNLVKIRICELSKNNPSSLTLSLFGG